MSAYTPVPWPEMVDVGEPYLDRIRFVNPRLLFLPKADPHAEAAVTTWSWSPDGKQLVLMGRWGKTHQIGNTGYAEATSLLVDLNNYQVTTWQTNARWPTWSRNGQSIFYQALYSDAVAIYADLYERRLDEKEGRLLLRSVGMVDSYQPSAIDTISGDLLLTNSDHQPLLLPAAARFAANTTNEKINPLLLADLAHKPTPRNTQGQLLPTRFRLSPDGAKVAVLPLGAPFYILDLLHYTLLAEFNDEWHHAPVVAWSRDSQALAFTTEQGVFVYDLAQGKTRALITRQDVQLQAGSLYDSFNVVTWSLDNHVVLFAVATSDWSPINLHPSARLGVFTFGALADGSRRRPLLAEPVSAFSPSGLHAILQRWNQQTQGYQAYLVDIQWGKDSASIAQP